MTDTIQQIPAGPALPSTTLPPGHALLDGLLVLSTLAMALVVTETSLHLMGQRRQRLNRLKHTEKRSLNLRELAERSAPGEAGMTMFKVGGAARNGPAVKDVSLPWIGDAPVAKKVVEVQAGEATLPEEVKRPAGWETFKVLEVVSETKEVKSFRFVLADGQTLTPFKSGQYLTIQTKPDGQDKNAIRCYSMSSPPTKLEFYQISVKAVEKGLVSNHLHRTLKSGDLVQCKRPSGKFFLDPNQTLDICLIAGGIGITPCYSMAQEFLQAGKRNRIDLFYGVRSLDEVCYPKHLDELAAKHQNFRLHIVVSRPTPEEPWAGLTGRIDLALMRKVLLYNLRGRAYYLCGPSQMMTDVTEGLVANGVPEDDVHFEAFGPAAPKKKPAPVS